METLELKPLDKKKLNILLLEKEYNEPFWVNEPPMNANSLKALFKPSIGFYKFLENLVSKVNVDFATDELGMRSKEDFEGSITTDVFRKSSIPYFAVDIDAAAKGYIEDVIAKKIKSRDDLLKALDSAPKQDDSMEKEYMIALGQSLEFEIEEHQHEVYFPIRESWMAMGILNHAREIKGKEEITCLHICSPEHLVGTKQLLESMNANVEVAKLSKKVIAASTEVPSSHEMENWLESIQIQVKPVIGKAGEEAPYLLFYIDTDAKASPFDICMAYDVGYDAVIPYENINPEDAKNITQDALLSRGPKGVKHTTFLIGGKDAERAEEVFQAVKDSMFPPFKTSIIIDPAGAYTTAAAMVAKAENALASNKLGELKDKTCAVFGTGAVGQIAAVLLAKLGCKVMIASLNPKRVDGKEHAEGIAKLLNKDHGVQVQGIFAPTPASKIEIIEKADVIMCAGVKGVRIIDKPMLNQVKHMKVLLDINAIPPFGVEGIELKDDMKEMLPGIFVIGALTVGDLKHKLEKEILREARSNGKDVYNFNIALPMARKLLEKEILPSKLAMTLNYQPSKKTTQ
ncbi:MAG TPA: NAD(P)-dependent methylenetetrahydromethanopterin dehydrogenase [Candidatus Limnocylindrales bacterium]|nr:NAD(P)-dependent methylenetetrahydromethanopterin dehydrogenase [Candidatus Limnocylindrales bacterium]